MKLQTVHGLVTVTIELVVRVLTAVTVVGGGVLIIVVTEPLLHVETEVIGGKVEVVKTAIDELFAETGETLELLGRAELEEFDDAAEVDGIAIAGELDTAELDGIAMAGNLEELRPVVIVTVLALAVCKGMTAPPEVLQAAVTFKVLAVVIVLTGPEPCVIVMVLRFAAPDPAAVTVTVAVCPQTEVEFEEITCVTVKVLVTVDITVVVPLFTAVETEAAVEELDGLEKVEDELELDPGFINEIAADEEVDPVDPFGGMTKTFPIMSISQLIPILAF